MDIDQVYARCNYMYLILVVICVNSVDDKVKQHKHF